MKKIIHTISKRAHLYFNFFFIIILSRIRLQLGNKFTINIFLNNLISKEMDKKVSLQFSYRIPFFGGKKIISKKNKKFKCIQSSTRFTAMIVHLQICKLSNHPWKREIQFFWQITIEYTVASSSRSHSANFHSFTEFWSPSNDNIKANVTILFRKIVNFGIEMELLTLSSRI